MIDVTQLAATLSKNPDAEWLVVAAVAYEYFFTLVWVGFGVFVAFMVINTLKKLVFSFSILSQLENVLNVTLTHERAMKVVSLVRKCRDEIRDRDWT